MYNTEFDAQLICEKIWLGIPAPLLSFFSLTISLLLRILVSTINITIIIIYFVSGSEDAAHSSLDIIKAHNISHILTVGFGLTQLYKEVQTLLSLFLQSALFPTTTFTTCSS
jgi:hypothetical protein